MRIYHKYILHLLNSRFCGIMLLLTGILWVTQSLRIIDLIINKGIELFSFIHLSFLLLPYLTFIVIPIAVFCVTIFISNRLTFDKEIIVLKSSGCSDLQIIKPFFTFGVLIMLLNYALSLYILPVSYNYFKTQYHDYKNNFVALYLEEGIFSTQTGNFTVYIDQKTEDNTYKGVVVYDARIPYSPKIVFASQGKLVEREGGVWFELQHGSHQEHTGEQQENLRILFFDRYTIDMNLLNDTPVKKALEPSEKFLHELWFNEKGASQASITKERANFHFRILWPLCCLAFSLLPAIYLSLGTHQRYHRQLKNVTISLVCILAIVLLLFLNNMHSNDIIIVSLQYILVAFILMASAVLLLRRMRYKT